MVHALLSCDRVRVNAANAEGATPLLVASHQGHAAVVRALLSAGADASEAANNGFSLLELARVKGHINVAEALVQGARLSASRRKDL